MDDDAAGLAVASPRSWTRRRFDVVEKTTAAGVVISSVAVEATVIFREGAHVNGV